MKSLKDLFSTIDLAFLGTVIIGIGYATSFAYSVGNYSYYKVPVNLIELKQSSLPFVIVSLLIFGYIIVWHVSNLTGDYKTQEERKQNLKKDVVLNAILIFGSAPFLFMFLLGFIGNSVGLTALVSFGYPILAFITQYIIVFKKYIYLLPVLFVVLICSYILGYNMAQEKPNYYIFEDEDNKMHVMLGTYNNNYIIAPVDLNKKSILPRYQLIEMKSSKDSKVELYKKKTGKLTVKKYAD